MRPFQIGDRVRHKDRGQVAGLGDGTVTGYYTTTSGKPALWVKWDKAKHNSGILWTYPSRLILVPDPIDVLIEEVT